MVLKGRKTVFPGMDKWKNLRGVRVFVQWISLVLFIFLLAYFPRVELFLRLDPFAGLSSSIAGRSVLVYFWPALFILILTLLSGRTWCGWICPLGTVLDITGFRKRKKTGKSPGIMTWETLASVKKHDTGLRKIKYLLLVMVLVFALFGNLSLLILDPLTIMIRTFTVSVLPAIRHMITGIELFLYNFDFLHDALDALDSLMRGTLIPFKEGYFHQNISILLVFLGIILLNLAAHRFWCRYLCPLGGLLALISRFAIFKRVVMPACTNCTSCRHVCSLDAVHEEKQGKSERGECTLCLDCFIWCSKNSLAISARREINPVEGIRISRKDFLLSASVAALGVAFLKGDFGGINPDTFLIRPPGVTDEFKFLSQCIRCGQCIRVCPTSGLQPCLLQSGINGFLTPRLAPRAGPCDYTCSLCGQVCPTGAIPELTLSIKHQTSLGRAVIDESRCLEWADGADCMVCREFCPLPVKAVERRRRVETDESGIIKVVHGPHVAAERCIGCGICENLCPVEGDAVIRVMRRKK